MSSYELNLLSYFFRCHHNQEIRKAQKLLIYSEKMASLGVLAAGVVHEINNPLNFIKSKIKNKIRVITNFTNNGIKLKGNEGRLHQVMMNIIANAV